MQCWIRFRFENGDTTLVNAEGSYFFFKSEAKQIEVYSTRIAPGRDTVAAPLFVFNCEYPDQVSAAEELIFEAIGKGETLTLSLDSLDEHAEYLNHVSGLRTVLQLIHQGNIRIPMEEGISESDFFETEDGEPKSEICRFEELLHTYLEVPDDSLRRAFRNEQADAPFQLSKDHEECADHGFHEYWMVATRPDRNYNFRKNFDDLVKSLIEKEGLSWQDNPHI